MNPKRSDRQVKDEADANDAAPAPTPLFGVVGADAPAPSEESMLLVPPDKANPPQPGNSPLPTSSVPEMGPFDPRRLRLSQRSTTSEGFRKRLVTVPVRKPSKEWFVRCHPGEEFRLDTNVLELKEDREVYLVEPDLWDLLTDEATFSPRLLTLTVTRNRTPFLWPIRLPGPDGRLDSWNESALEAATTAQSSWVRVSANMQLGAYDVIEAPAIADEPVWPTESMSEILTVAFRGKTIDSMDHPVLRRLRGEV